MTLYITYTSVLEEVSKEISSILERDGHRMLIFYTGNSSSIPGVVLDYISQGRIQIRRIPSSVEKSAAVIAYEIGCLHTANPEDRFVLLGTGVFSSIYRLLIQYDQSISTKLEFRSLRENGKNPQQNSDKASQESGSESPSSESHNENSRNSGKPKSCPKKQQNKFSNSNSTNSTNTGDSGNVGSKSAKGPTLQPTKERRDGTSGDNTERNAEGKKFEERTKGVDEKPAAKTSEKTPKASEKVKEKSPETSSKPLREKKDTQENTRQKEEAVLNTPAPGTVLPEEPVNSTEPQTAPEESADGNVSMNEKKLNEAAVDNVFLSFHNLLDDIVGDKTTDMQCNNVMMAAVDILEVQDQTAAKEIFEKNLQKYFLSERKAKYFWTRIKNRFEELVHFLEK